jgi:hypothetical protein
MPLILDPAGYSRTALLALATQLADDLAEVRELTVEPRGRVLDPASLETARELVDVTLVALRRTGERSNADLAADTNLAYVTMLAALDLVKSHTDVPRVPAPRKGPAP